MTQSQAKRKRGVKASRSKIEKAMLDAGIPTQLKLAKKIADLDPELSHPPKDMISRVMRGNSVDPKNIERIAKALDVEAYQLYASSSDRLSLNEPSSISKKTNNNRIIVFTLLSFFVGVTLSLIYITIGNHQTPDSNVQLPKSNQITPFPINGKPVLTSVVGLDSFSAINLESSIADDFIDTVNQNLSSDIKAKSIILKSLADDISPWDLNEKIGSQLTLSIETEFKGRLVALFMDAYSNTNKQTIFADIFYLDELKTNSDTLMLRMTNSIKELTGSKNTEEKSYVPSKEAVLQLLDGAVFFDEPLQVNIISLGLNHFYRALAIDPDYAKAHAWLCRGLVGSYVMQSDEKVLQQAQSACESAKSEQQSLEYLLASAYLLNKTGNPENALDIIEQAAALYSKSVDASLLKAEILIYMAMNDGSKELLDKALLEVEKAIEMAPEFWRPNYVKGRALYFSGQALAAIEAIQKSVNINANSSNLLNLATSQFCFGEPVEAKSIYQQVIALPYTNPLAIYNYSSVLGALGEFQQAAVAVEQYLSVLELENSDPPLEGLIGVADTFRHAGILDKAEQYYLSAFEEGEKILIKNPDNNDVKLQLLYVEITLTYIRQLNFTEQQVTDFSERLDAFEAFARTPNSILLLLFSNDLIGREEKAKRFYNTIAPVCNGFAEATILQKYRN